MAIKGKVGDVFLIPLDERRNGVGQIIHMVGAELYLAIYGLVLSANNTIEPETVIGEIPIFTCLSLDAKFGMEIGE